MKPFSGSDSFQSEVMIEKIKKVKGEKKKKRKCFEKEKELGINYKNIEIFDKIIGNDEEKPQRYKSFDDVYKETVFENFTSSFREGLNKKGSKKKGLMTKNGIADFSPPELWEGMDDIKDQGDSVPIIDPRQIIIDAINAIYNAIEQGKLILAQALCLKLGDYSVDKNSLSLINFTSAMNAYNAMTSQINEEGNAGVNFLSSFLPTENPDGKKDTNKTKKKDQNTNNQSSNNKNTNDIQNVDFDVEYQDKTTLDQFNSYFSFYSLSQDIALKNDTAVLKNNIGMFLSILIGYFILYDLFYITFYEISPSKKPDFAKFTEDNLKDYWDHPLAKTFLFNSVLKYAFFFPIKITDYGTEIIPKMIKSWISMPFIFVLLYSIIIRSIYFCAPAIKQFFIDMMSIDIFNLEKLLKNIAIVFLYLSVIVLFFTDKERFPSDEEMSENQKEMKKARLLNSLLYVVYLISLFLYFVFIIVTCPPISGIVTLGYIVYLCFFSILYHKGISEYSETCKSIDEFIKLELREDTKCEPKSIFEKITDLFSKFIHFIQKNIFFVFLFFAIMFSSTDYSKNIKNEKLNDNLQTINNTIISFIITYFLLKKLLEYIMSLRGGPEINSSTESFMNQLFWNDIDETNGIVDPLNVSNPTPLTSSPPG